MRCARQPHYDVVAVAVALAVDVDVVPASVAVVVVVAVAVVVVVVVERFPEYCYKILLGTSERCGAACITAPAEY